eukprot:3506897-Karenia_brevis.AAC.1
MDLDLDLDVDLQLTWTWTCACTWLNLRAVRSTASIHDTMGHNSITDGDDDDDDFAALRGEV